MAKSNNQKGKILYLERLLWGTGENHIVTMQEILAFLQEKGIHAERKSIYDDMEVLRSIGLDVRYLRGRPGGYYLAGFTEDQDSKIWENDQGGTLAVQEGTDGPANLADGSLNTASSFFSEKGDTLPKEETGEQTRLRQVKLVLEEGYQKPVQAFFGDNVQIRSRQEGLYTVCAQVEDGPLFYGWLTAMGLHVRLLKPKKMQQSYREYLKDITREYKLREY